jgi:hypothetical protein
MNDNWLRRRCEARLRELDLPDPFDARSFCKALGERRSRPIRLRAVPGGEGACGVWVSAPSADLIFYEKDTSPLHQEHIILHEISHLLCGHAPAPVTEHETSQLLFPDFDLETIELVLPRAGYSTEEEREAEILASLILERAAAGSPVRTSPRKGGGDEVLHRLEASLQADRGES